MKTWDPFTLWFSLAAAAWLTLATFLFFVARSSPKTSPTPPPVAPPVVRCILDSAQIARFATYFTPAEN